ncbi:MAG: hypothetical protein IT495_13755 [Gammaproteobacteria bacterium]|nr:hypothetical protein [Gammaproteobacteria bacterium]
MQASLNAGVTAASRSRRRRRITASALCLAACTAAAGTIEQAAVSYANGRYSASAELRLDAPVANVRAIALDHDRIARVSDMFTASRLIERYDDRHAKRRIDAHTCVLVFCFDFVMTEDVEEQPDGVIVTTIIPAQSDFRAGASRWEIVAAGPRTTILRFSTYREPDFWVPPLIGPWIVKQKLRKELIASMLRIEELARAADGASP